MKWVPLHAEIRQTVSQDMWGWMRHSWTCERNKGGGTESWMYWRMFAHALSLESQILQEGNRSLACPSCYGTFCLCQAQVLWVWGWNWIEFLFPDHLYKWKSRLFLASSRCKNERKCRFDDLLCACALLYSPVQLRAQTAALQSLHTPSYSSRALSWIR